MTFRKNVSKTKGRIAYGREIEIIQHRFNTLTGKTTQLQNLMTDDKSGRIDDDPAEVGHKQDQDGQHHTVRRTQWHLGHTARNPTHDR